MNVSRRQVLASAAAFVPKTHAQPARKPNVIFILADDLGWADLPVYSGPDLHETPELDTLARSSTRFTQAYSASPVCSPTRASILTGKHPARLGITIWHEGSHRGPTDRPLLQAKSEDHLKHEEVTLAEKFHDAGYRTFHIGKWHLGTSTHGPETQGFDLNIGGTHWGAPQTYFHPYKATQGFNGEFRFVPGLANSNPGDYLTDQFTNAAIAAIDRAGRDPFFLNLWFHNPHTPIECKPEYADYFTRKRTPVHKHHNAKYAGMIRSLSENVGRMLKHLDARGLAKNTIVVFCSDNGGYTEKHKGEAVTTNAPLRSGKGSLYEGGIRIPLMVRWPGVTKPGSICDLPITTCDLFPTLLEAAGVASDNRPIDGRSFAAQLRGNNAPSAPRDLFFHYPHYYPTTTPVSAVRSGDWKLLEYYESGTLELYNLRDDPSEERDMAATNPNKARELSEKLARWRTETGARLPTPNPAYKKHV